MELAAEIWIGIDEHSFSGRDMVAIIVDIKEMVPLAILNNNQMETIQAWFRSLPMEIKKKIKGVASDMNA
jgi:transposase